jgi:hypothetical protein
VRLHRGPSHKGLSGPTGQRVWGPVLAPVAVAAAIALTGCGSEAADLFVVTRAGSIPAAALRLRITDDGRASCNGRDLVEISSDELIRARDAARRLEDPARKHLDLGRGAGSVLRYRVRTEDGSVSWSDTSRGQPPVLFALAKLTRDVARGPCRLPR